MTNVQTTQLEDWEKGWPLRRHWPWWFHLLVFGHAAPIPDDQVKEMKQVWFDSSTADRQRRDLMVSLQTRFNERQSSTLDTFVKLTIIGAIIVVITDKAYDILSAPDFEGTAWAWAALLTNYSALACTLLMITSKFKVWKRQDKVRVSVGLQLIRTRNLKGWPEYLRLARKLRHRQQLIKLERRLLGLACGLILVAHASWQLALAQL